MLPASPESIEALFHYHCDTLETLKEKSDGTEGLLQECVDRCKRRIDDILDLYKNLGYLSLVDEVDRVGGDPPTSSDTRPPIVPL